MSGLRAGRYHLLALAVIVLTATSLFMLGRLLTRIEATLPPASLHQERDFAVVLLDVSRLEAALRVAVAAPTPEKVGQFVSGLDLAAQRNRDSLYRHSDLPGIAEFQRDFDRSLTALEAGLGQAQPTAARLEPHLEQVERLRFTLQRLNDTMFQNSMQKASAQQRYLGQLGQVLSVVLFLFGGFALASVYFALRQQRNIQALGEREAQLRESEASYRGLFDSVGEAIHILDENRRFLDVNVGAERMYGHRREDLIGRTPAFVAAPGRNDLDQLARRLREALAGSPQQFEFWGLRKNGEVFLVQAWINRGRYFGRDVAIAMSADISERKRMEEELRRSNAELEQFAYAISHDMRQPLRMITSYQQLLEKSLHDKLDDDNRAYLHFATDGARRLDQMLVGLLDYSRLGSKTGPLDWVDSREALEEALLFLKPAIEEAKARIRVAGDWPRLRASHDELVRLFQNLIGNAVKFRAAGRVPEVDAVGELVADRWRVRIGDNGIGIAAAQIPRLFRVFQRLQARARFDGAGVGLALCRKIVEHHGGRIHAESAGEGQGSTFVFELPLTHSPPPGEGDRAAN
jgi:PAS domain S-box-containing protein